MSSRLAFGVSLSDDDRARVALCCERGACALYSETGAWLAGGEVGQSQFITPARCRSCRYREPCSMGRMALL